MVEPGFEIVGIEVLFGFHGESFVDFLDFLSEVESLLHHGVFYEVFLKLKFVIIMNLKNLNVLFFISMIRY